MVQELQIGGTRSLPYAQPGAQRSAQTARSEALAAAFLRLDLLLLLNRRRRLDGLGDLTGVEVPLGAIKRRRPAGGLLGELGPHVRQCQVLRTAIEVGRTPRKLETLRSQCSVR